MPVPGNTGPSQSQPRSSGVDPNATFAHLALLARGATNMGRSAIVRPIQTTRESKSGAGIADGRLKPARAHDPRVEDSVCKMLEPFVAPRISGVIAVRLALTAVLSSVALIWVLQNVRFAPFSSVCEPTPGAPQSEQGTEILEDM